MNFNELYKKTLAMRIAALLLALTAFALSLPVYAWFAKLHMLAAYAPISSPEALFIGAGHTSFEDNQFEDIRYMYFTGLDVTKVGYDYRVFCIYGKAVSGYKLQLAYTTNNQFTYELFHAYESESEGSVVSYVTHGADPATYYYALGEQITGKYLNKKTVDGEDLATTVEDNAADSEVKEYHGDTYAIYDGEGNKTGVYDKVNKYAEPIYWQTVNPIAGNAKGSFVHYYIIRVDKGAKINNDRETDILCIAAKIYNAQSDSSAEEG